MIAEITAGWMAGSDSLGTLIIDENTAATLATIWGPPGPGSKIVGQDELIQALWSARPSWTIVPFQRLSPELKVLRLDGISPLATDFNRAAYPLTVAIGLTGDPAGVAQIQSSWPGPKTNRDPGRLSTVAMSGVTALGRATAFQMEIGGITTPGLVVGPVLQAADIAHISHEVPFATNCPYPNPIGDPIFCARDGYLALIQSLGTDLVELTGNHVNDWGAENLVHSIELYESAGMETFGGGRQLAEAKAAALFEHNGNKIAFVGCNPVGPAYAWATENSAGSMPCHYEEFYKQIGELRDAGYLVIATLQYFEFYHYAPTAQQQADFRAVADAGAAAVSGSQGHHAQGFDLHNGAFIHYGLGNLFFDQMDMLGTRQSFIDTYTIYEGRLINVDLFTSLIENYCCPRAMSNAERQQLLQTVFQASGW
jgi:poly-gamma-glutamate synthesis protein (capsule biosynthesis protein)